ncbi:MAG: non-canonical purine NTP pyrophosphatase [bacterium]|nr:non-canonical purine NTP pyrophosphatase [bacterium]
MKKLLIATRNEGKLRELTSFLSDLPIQIVSLTNLGITDDVEEDGTTYAENAKKKALFYAKRSSLPTLSDDGGLEIAALGNAPGINSKRWLGEGTTEEDLLEHMHRVANDLPDTNRNAAFINVVAFALPTGEVFASSGRIDGIIARKPSGKRRKGLPYRLYFFLPGLNMYYDEAFLTREQMAQYNHRRQSVESIKPVIQDVLLTHKN